MIVPGDAFVAHYSHRLIMGTQNRYPAFPQTRIAGIPALVVVPAPRLRTDYDMRKRPCD